MAALNAQGKVAILGSPRLSMLNNEPGIVKTDAITLTVTPQISPDAIVTLTADGTIDFLSESSVRLLGFAREERIGHNGFELIHPDDVAAVRESFAACLQQPGVPMPTECRMHHKDGTWRWHRSI